MQTGQRLTLFSKKKRRKESLRNSKKKKKEKKERKMDSWIVTQVSFWFTVNKVKPAQIVDKCIELFVDMFTPGRGVGEGNWIQRGIRQIEQTSERTQREIDIRSSLRDWDNSFPEIHHELIVRWVAGAVVSLTVSSVYNSLKGALFGSSSSQYNNRGRR